MLAVHWTPVNNTKSILKNGIRKSKRGLFCFPLTGNKMLDKWWVNFFNQCHVRARKKYNGIVFRIMQEDLPAHYGHWIGDPVKDITDLKAFEERYRETILWRMGERVAWQKSPNGWMDSDKYAELGEAAVMGIQRF